jgi:hypothetical protein
VVEVVVFKALELVALAVAEVVGREVQMVVLELQQLVRWWWRCWWLFCWSRSGWRLRYGNRHFKSINMTTNIYRFYGIDVAMQLLRPNAKWEISNTTFTRWDEPSRPCPSCD